MVKVALLSWMEFNEVELREFGELISCCMKVALSIDNRSRHAEYSITPTETDVTVVALKPGDAFPYDSVFMKFGEGSGTTKIEVLARVIEQSCKMEWNLNIARSSALMSVVTVLRTPSQTKDRAPVFRRLFDVVD